MGAARDQRIGFAAAALATSLILLGALPAAATAGVARPADPVVLEGADVDRLRGARPERLVGYRYLKPKQRWDQVPVQVDERANVDLGAVYDGEYEGIVVETYTDPGTFTGPDPNPRFDAGDEIALMANEARRRARAHRKPVREPRGVFRRSGVEVRVRSDDGKGWLYLFRARPRRGPNPSAGEDLVDYDFELLSGDYRATYDIRDGPNPEDSVIETGFYRLRFTDRWVNDVLELGAGGADGRDILDRRNAQFSPGFCGRSIDTFTDAEGAFVVNRDGPVRAIRSYIGANSGPLTQREHLFYERREDVNTYLRVHGIPGVIDFWDYSPEARGMRYRAAGLAGGVKVDGIPDPVGDQPRPWEQLSGRQGTVTHVLRLETDAPGGLPTAGYYLDQRRPDDADELQCTGDDAAYGASGLWVDGPIPNTDPLRGPAIEFTGRRTTFYDGPDRGRRAAVRRAGWVDRPLAVAVRRYR